jgi:hypothetical protein
MFPMDVPSGKKWSLGMQWGTRLARNGHWECNGGLDWQGMAIGNTMKKKALGGDRIG